jgi:hypothetical protein
MEREKDGERVHCLAVTNLYSKEKIKNEFIKIIKLFIVQ